MLNLARLVSAPPGANPAYPVTVVVWVGPAEARELVGLAADAALEVVEVPPAAVVAGGRRLPARARRRSRARWCACSTSTPWGGDA